MASRIELEDGYWLGLARIVVIGILLVFSWFSLVAGGQAIGYLFGMGSDRDLYMGAMWLAVIATVCVGTAAALHVSGVDLVVLVRELGLRLPGRMWWSRLLLLVGLPVVLAAVAIYGGGPLADWSAEHIGPQLDQSADSRFSGPGMGHWWAVAGFSFLGPGLFEELAHRGPLVWLSHRPVPRWLVGLAVVASTALFAAGHAPYGMPNVVVTFAGGLMFSAAAIWCRSLVPVILAHGAYDFVAYM